MEKPSQRVLFYFALMSHEQFASLPLEFLSHCDFEQKCELSGSVIYDATIVIEIGGGPLVVRRLKAVCCVAPPFDRVYVSPFHQHS